MSDTPPEGTSLFQIYESDLLELERLLPIMCSSLYPAMNPRIATQFERVKIILSNIRWNYGPPMNVEVIPHD